MGLEPHDLRVMSPTSYQLLYPAIYSVLNTTVVPVTGVEPVRELNSHGILSPGRLPIPPHRHFGCLCIILHRIFFVNTFFQYLFSLNAYCFIYISSLIIVYTFFLSLFIFLNFISLSSQICNQLKPSPMGEGLSYRGIAQHQKLLHITSLFRCVI